MPKVDSDDIPLITRDMLTLFPLSLFRCASQTRELDDWERGYWKVDLSLWPVSEKHEFWKRMRKAVEGGRFGWINILFDVVPFAFKLTIGNRRRYFRCVLFWSSSETCMGVVIRNVVQKNKTWITLHRFPGKGGDRRDFSVAR